MKNIWRENTLGSRTQENRTGKLRILDLFCGAGGTSLGVGQALQSLELPYEILGVDIDRNSCLTFQKNKIGQAVRADVNSVPLRMVKGLFDVVVGCPPCQGFSRMRAKLGNNDPRNALVLVFIACVKKLRPNEIMFENVGWICKTPYSKQLQKKLQRLGYKFDSDVLDGADFGVPQRRKRFVLIASLTHQPELPEPTHTTPNKAKKKKKKPWVTVRQAIANLPSLVSGEDCPEIPLHKAMKHSELALRRIRAIPKNGGSRSTLPTQLQLLCHLNSKGHSDVYGRMRWDNVSPTLTSGCTNPTKGRFIHPEQDRGITAREAARLQTFQDHIIFAGNSGACARQIGNAMPPAFVQTITVEFLRLCTLKGFNSAVSEQ